MKARAFLGGVLGVAVLALAPGIAHARDAIVSSFDGTPIVTHFFPAQGLQGGERAPTIMVGHGWGGSGEMDENGGDVGPFREAGYNVLTWDARGFGGSGGTVRPVSGPPRYRPGDEPCPEARTEPGRTLTRVRSPFKLIT